MKHQQVVVDYWTMMKTSALCLLLAITGFIFLRMVQTIFWLPKRFKQNQEKLEAIAQRYRDEMPPEEQAELEKLFNSKEPLTDEQIRRLLDGSKQPDAVEPKRQPDAVEPKKEQ